MKTSTILLTGACGFLGSWITLRLLEAGHRVRGTSRELAFAKGLFGEAFSSRSAPRELRDRLELVPAELLEQSDWPGKADGCDVVVHTACPVATEVGTARTAMLDPALVGTEHVVREAARAGVRRFVHMSSLVTTFDHHRPRARGVGPERYGPRDWNETASPDTDPYAHAKVLGERRAKTLVSELLPEADFVSALPGPVVGPPIAGRRIAASVTKTLAPFVDGKLRLGSVDLELPLVDVRDVADAFVRLVELPRDTLRSLDGPARFVLVRQPVPTLQEVADAIRAEVPSLARMLPRRAIPLPPWALLPAMRLGTTREEASYARAMLGRRVELDTRLAEDTLGIRWRPLGPSLVDSIASLRAARAQD